MFTAFVDMRTHLVHDYNDGKMCEPCRKCYELWNRSKPCPNCSSERAVQQKKQIMKMEYLGDKSILILNDAIQPFKIENRFRSGLLSNTYSDNYAGSYLDDSGLLNIGYVNEVELPTYDNQVIYVKKDYSYNLLLEIQNAITCKMIEYNVKFCSIR